jgi:hypothetical protein
MPLSSAIDNNEFDTGGVGGGGGGPKAAVEAARRQRWRRRWQGWRRWKTIIGESGRQRERRRSHDGMR